MRLGTGVLILLLTLGMAACSREDRDEAARKAGKTAQKVTEETKEAAKKAGQGLREAAQKAREGWNEGKRERQADGKK